MLNKDSYKYRNLNSLRNPDSPQSLLTLSNPKNLITWITR